MPNTYSNRYQANPAWKRVKEIDEKMEAIRKKALALRNERIKLVGEIYGRDRQNAATVQQGTAGSRRHG